jgi:hypothetical protein
LCRTIRHLGSGIGTTKATHTRSQPLFEIARVLVRCGHVASRIVNANHSIV